MKRLSNSYIESLEGESQGRLFADLWPVAPDYRIDDGQVCPLAEGRVIPAGSFTGCRSYLPMREIGLPAELAKAATGHEADVLAFVRRYGLLGYGPAVFHEPLISARHLEGDHSENAPPLQGDPIAWFTAHAKTVKLVLGLIGSLEKDLDVRAAIDLLRVKDGQRESIEYDYACRGHLRPTRHRLARVLTTADGEYHDANRAEPRTVARNIIANVLNENIKGVSRHLVVEWQMDDTDAEGFSSLFGPHNLLDVIYWRLADAAIGGWVRRCAYPRCGAFFIAKSLKAKYCPPPSADSESPCMNRHKQRKWRIAHPKPKPKKQKGKRR